MNLRDNDYDYFIPNSYHWMWAAVGGDGTKIKGPTMTFTETVLSNLNHCRLGGERDAPGRIAQFLPTKPGAFDLFGNAKEMVLGSREGRPFWAGVRCFEFDSNMHPDSWVGFRFYRRKK